MCGGVISSATRTFAWYGAIASRPSKYRGWPYSGMTMVKSNDFRSPGVTSFPCHQASRFWKSNATRTAETASISTVIRC